MTNTLYIQTDTNMMVNHPHVTLQDIAKLSCSDDKILNRVRVLPVADLQKQKPGRYVLSATDLIREIQKKEPDLTITTIGTPDFIITWQQEPAVSAFWNGCKTAFVCLCTFFGSAFSIMTFNNDVDVPALFGQIYTQVTGQSSSNFTVLEISYSIGIGLGILFFFNHFGKMHLTDDPTPMQVQMRLYEDNVNTTILEDVKRLEENKS